MAITFRWCIDNNNFKIGKKNYDRIDQTPRKGGSELDFFAVH